MAAQESKEMTEPVAGVGDEATDASEETDATEGALDQTEQGEGATSAEEADVDVEALRLRVAEAEAAVEATAKEKDELYDRWLRLQAEFDNFRKRTRREMDESRARGAEDLVVKLLPVLDNLERAIASVDSGAVGGFAEGVRMIHKQFLTVLEGVGVTPIQAVGNPFDPNLHEAVAYEASDDHPEGTVMEEMLRGYSLGDKVIRASMVKVARGSGQQGGDEIDE